MNAKVEEQSASKLDPLKWILVVALVAAGVVGNSLYSEEIALLYRVLGLLAVAGVAGFIASFTAQGKAFIDLVKEARIEMKKVVWPSRQETFQTTLVVLAVVALMSLILFIVDWVLNWAISALVG